MGDPTRGLNPAQLEAVTHGEGPLLVLAGAGTGKTRVITHRIAWLIEEGASPDSLLAVTFTNRSAGELKERLGHMLGRAVARGVRAGTFHSFGLHLVRTHARRLGLPARPTVVDASDQAALLRRLLRAAGVPKTIDPRDVARAISSAKRSLVAPDDYQSSGDPAADVAGRVYGRYERSLRAMGGVDFDDLLVLPVRLLEAEPALTTALRQELPWLLVDEFQDTSAVQLRMVRLLSGPSGNLTAVGDDDQAIYGWRGADSRNVRGFEALFPGARILKLEQNYRSTEPILAAANAVIGEIPDRRPKRLWTRQAGGEPIATIVGRDEVGEAQRVVDDLLVRHAAGRGWADFAVLYRTNAQSQPFEEALRAERVPHHVVGGTRFFDRKEVRDVLAYWRLLANPYDEVSLRRVLNWPARGIGMATVEALSAAAREGERALWTILASAAELPVLQARATKACASFVALLARHRERVESDPHGAASGIVEEGRLLEAIRAEAASARDAHHRLRHVNDMLGSLEHHVRHADDEGDDPSLAAFLTKVSLDQRDEEPDKGDGEQVTLTTLHASKGLEFPVVYLVGMEEGLLPFRRQGIIRDLEEERRLAYVGMTRAREVLTLARAGVRSFRGERRPRSPSRFLAPVGSLPAEAVAEVSAPEAPSAPTSSERRALSFIAAARDLLKE